MVREMDTSDKRLTRRDVLRSGAMFTLAAGLAPLAAGCTSRTSGGDQSGPAPKQIVRMGLADTFAAFNPATAVQQASLSVCRQIFEPLIRFDPLTGQTAPWIFEDWPKASGDRLMTASVRDGMSFHDGSPVGASDVAFTVEYMKDPANGSPYGAFLSRIERVKTSGRQVTFELSEDYGAFASLLSVVTLLPQKAFNSLGKDKFGTNPIGSGPYKFDTSQPGAQVSVARYEAYKGRYSAALDTIDFRYISDNSTRQIQLTSGQLEIIAKVPFRDVASLADQSATTAKGVASGNQMVLETNHNTGKSVIANEKVRQALIYGMDRDAIVQSVFLGSFGEVADSMLLSSNPFFVQPTTVYRHDPDKAKSLLAEAGYPNGVDFELMCGNQDFLQQSAQLMQQQWAQCGLRATIKLTETEAGYGIVATQKYDTFLAYSNLLALGSDPDIVYRMFTYGQNRTGFFGSNTAAEQSFDQLVDKGLLAPTPEERKAYYAEAQNVFSGTVMNNFPLINMYNCEAWRNSVTGYQPTADTLPFLMTTRIAS